MVVAQELSKWIVEPTNELSGASGYDARKRHRTTDSTTHYGATEANDMFQAISDDIDGLNGGLVYIKNGVYPIDSGGAGHVWGQVDWPANDDGVGSDYFIHLLGETRDGVIIKNANSSAVDEILFTMHANCLVENMCFDGDDVSDDNMNLLQFHNSGNPYTAGMTVRNCRFRKHTGIGVLTDNARYVELIGNYFELPSHTSDQAAIGQSEGYCHVYGNTFERLSGALELDGSSLTSGCMENAVISNNVIRREPSHYFAGISLEPFDSNPDYHNILISNNNIQNGVISVGGLGTWGTLFHNVHVVGNSITGAHIQYLGPESGVTDQVKDCSIRNNILYDPYYAGISITATAGRLVVSKNEIHHSNIAQDATTFDKGCFYIADTVDLVVNDNDLYMDVVDPEDSNYCPMGIKTAGTNENFEMRENRIHNRTVANASYQLSGSFTGTKLISMSK